MTPRAEEVWSYLIGLAPLGEPVAADDRLRQDLRIPSKSALLNHLVVLETDGCIKRIAPRLFAVLKHIGPAEQKKPAPRNAADETPTNRCEIFARLAEIPKFDMRDLTGRVFGDPLPERSALARRA